MNNKLVPSVAFENFKALYFLEHRAFGVPSTNNYLAQKNLI